MSIQHCPYHPGYPRDKCPWDHSQSNEDWKPPITPHVRSSREQKENEFTPSKGCRRCPTCNGKRVEIRGHDGKKIRCSTCFGLGEVKDEPRCHITPCHGDNLFESWAEVYTHMKTHDVPVQVIEIQDDADVDLDTGDDDVEMPSPQMDLPVQINPIQDDADVHRNGGDAVITEEDRIELEKLYKTLGKKENREETINLSMPHKFIAQVTLGGRLLTQYLSMR